MLCSLPLPLLAAGQSVVNVYINKDKNFAFVEFRTGGVCGCVSGDNWLRKARARWGVA
jgi:hypothetical protein